MPRITATPNREQAQQVGVLDPFGQRRGRLRRQIDDDAFGPGVAGAVLEAVDDPIQAFEAVDDNRSRIVCVEPETRYASDPCRIL